LWQFGPQTGDKGAKNAETPELVSAFRDTIESGPVNSGGIVKDTNEGGDSKYTASNGM
jgi:hypothetical protein